MSRCAVVLALVLPSSAWAVCPVAAGDLAGANLTLAAGDCLDGVYTNVGTLTVPSGVLVDVLGSLQIYADSIVIDGVLDGNAAGAAGGAGATLGVDNASPGTGPGAGGAGDYGPCVHGGGGGGGGFGGPGGQGPSFNGIAFYSTGGPNYGLAWPSPIVAGNVGSGGGGAGAGCADPGAGGGFGGGSIHLEADLVTVNGVIRVDGSPGGNASNYSGGSGGGSGGSLTVVGGAISGTGLLSAKGGPGGSTVQGIGGLAGGGGGGAGGRIAVSSDAHTLGMAVGGGKGGLSQKIVGLLEDNGFPGAGGTSTVVGSRSLSFGGYCPGKAQVGLAGLTPSGSFLVVAGGTTGTATVPSGPCMGTVTGLGPTAKVMTAGFADASGNANLSPTMKANTCGKPVQVVDETTCTLSNVGYIP